MLQYQHVRFRLTEFLRAVEGIWDIEEERADLLDGLGNAIPVPPTVQEAFDWYWNLCSRRGWKLTAVMMARDTQTTVSYLERNSQLNFRCEEYWNMYWNIVWETQGDQPIESRFDPDIVHGVQHLAAFHQQIGAELRERGWAGFGEELHMGEQVIKTAWFPGKVSRVGPIVDSLEIQAGCDCE